MKRLVFGILLWTLSGCYTQHRAERQVIRAQAHYPQVVAGLCADIYPPVEFIKDSFIYLPGRVLPAEVKYVTVDCDSAKKAGTTVVKLPCPPVDIRTPDTIAIIKHTQAVNKAKEQELLYDMETLRKQLAACNADVAVKEKAISELKGEKRRLWLWLLAIGIYTLAKLIIKQVPALSWMARWLI